MHAAIQQLDQAIHAHYQWLELINATLICRLEPDARELAEDAHRHCRFGQWVYGEGRQLLGEHAGFTAVESEHRRLHAFAHHLLKIFREGDSVPLRDYENFQATLKRVRLEVEGLRHEVESALFDLDPLTGIAGRAGLLPTLREQQAIVERGLQDCTVIMFDLDHFKLVNDTYGHQTGDDVLVEFARRMRQGLRPYDRLFRYGGEEFLLCASQTDPDQAMNLAERLRLATSDVPFQTREGAQISVSVSIGLAALGSSLAVEDAIDRADKALFAAKAGGRNRCVRWTDSMA